MGLCLEVRIGLGVIKSNYSPRERRRRVEVGWRFWSFLDDFRETDENGLGHKDIWDALGFDLSVSKCL